jgi:membrane associated rhomboid family serine protease
MQPSHFKTPPPAARPPSPVVHIVLAACVALYGVQALSSPGFEEGLVQAYALIPARVSGAWPTWRVGGFFERNATLITALFLHSGLGHIVGNMLFLYIIGRPVEWVLGSVHTALLYGFSGIAGGLVQIWLDPSSPLPVLGASGAISGLFAVYALLFSRTKVAGKNIFGLHFSGGILRIAWIIAFWIGLQLSIGMFFNDDAMGGIAIGAHIGGFLGGILYSLWLRLLSSAR